MSAQRLYEAEDRVRRVQIGSCQRMSSRSSVGRALNGLLKCEVRNCINVHVDEAVGEGQLESDKIM